MLRRCFELGTPLRSKNRNTYFFIGNILALVTNVIITVLFYDQYGILAPAFAFVISDVIMALYLAYMIKIIYQITFHELFMWNKIGKILLAASAGIPLMWFASVSGSITLLFSSIVCYLVVYYLIIKMINVDEAELIIEKFKRITGIKNSRKATSN